MVEEGGPEGRGRVVEEHAAVEEPVGGFPRRVRGVRDGGWGYEGAGVAQRGVGAVGRDPFVGGPGVVVEVADADVVGGEVVGAGEPGVGEGGIHVAEDGDVGVEEDEGGVAG